MDIIESIKKDKAYLKCKLLVKTWEKDFKTTHNRTPTKFDIKEAPAKIKYAYKKYFQLKSNALENSLSLCDIEIDDIIASPDPLQELQNTATDTLSPSPEIPDLPSGHEIEKLLSTSNIQKNVTITPFTENLSKKLFQNRKFSLRNPRKLSLAKLQSRIDYKSMESDKVMKAVQGDGDEFRFDKSHNKDQSCNIAKDFTHIAKDVNISMPTCLSNTYDGYTKQPMRQVDGEWLNRVNGTAPELSTILNKPEKFGLGNLKVVETNDKQADFVENSESDDDDNIALNKLKPALKKRKLDCDYVSFNTGDPVIHDDPKYNKVSKSDQHKKKSNKKDKITDITENHLPPDISEYVPLGFEKDILPRNIQILNVLNTAEAIPDSCGKPKFSEGSNHLENKMKQGTINDNFVKINIEKKVFVRGKKGINYSKYKKQQWKNKKSLHGGMEFPESGKMACFKCGEGGHMARYCRAHKGETLLPLESYKETEIPTLEDMQNYTLEPTCSTESITKQLQETIYEPSEIPDSFLEMLSQSSDPTNNDIIKPIYNNVNEKYSNDLLQVLHKFQHESFRPGQENAIYRILCGMSTLLILSTGGGKSLCYQLPAYIYSQHYKCITLVISPLVSLMEDQVLNVPEFLKAGCYHTNQTETQRRKILECLKEGQLNILLISPEALIAGDSASGLSSLFKSLPPIAFACIDEAHCVSQWSHNFRPSYLMICRVLREKLNVKCILGLTATASQTTIKSIISHINIPDGTNGVVRNPALPDNLCLSVSMEKDKDKALVSYLLSDEIISYKSIIVYCIRRDECERVAAVLRSCLQETGKVNMERKTNKRKRMSYIAEAYHAGMSAAQRKKIQKHFMDGTLQIIVATVAFGMGINKSDIRCIIHYNMPSSFESYVQEVGRAGRDGLPANCHVMLSNSKSDKNELLKHIHSNSIDRQIIRKLLAKVFIPCECVKSFQGTSSHYCKGHEVGIPIDATVEELDLPSENIATLLCYVELHPKQFIKFLNNAYIYCKISSYGGPKKIHEAAKLCRPLAMALLLEGKKTVDIMNKSTLEFNVIEVAAAIGWESGITKYHLKNLEWCNETGISQRSFLKVEFNTLGFRIRARGDLNPTELDNILDDLHNSVTSQEKSRLYQLEECNLAFHSIAKQSLEDYRFSKDNLTEVSNKLKDIIRDYFERDQMPSHMVLEVRPIDAERVASDVRALICTYKDCNFSGRSIARIFQGISSPNYPALVWGRCKFWRSHLDKDFNALIKIATQQIIQMKML